MYVVCTTGSIAWLEGQVWYAVSIEVLQL